MKGGRSEQSRHDHEDDGEGRAEGPTALLVVEQVELVGTLKVTKAFVFHFSLQGVRGTSVHELVAEADMWL